MTSRRSIAPASIAIATGFALWLGASALSGKREAWDASTYWVLAYPAALLACAILGYTFPERSWRWPVILFEAQFVAMCLRDGELGSLWPLGMVLFAVIALPGILIARLAARFSEAPVEEST